MKVSSTYKLKKAILLSIDRSSFKTKHIDTQTFKRKHALELPEQTG